MLIDDNRWSYYTYMLHSPDLPDMFYIGSRRCKGSPINDDRYFSSSELIKKLRLGGVKFQREIIQEYHSDAECRQAEQALITETNAVTSINGLNLNSWQNPYTVENTARKIIKIKKQIPKWNFQPEKQDFGKILPWEHEFLTGRYWISNNYNSVPVWKFTGHPQRLHAFWPSRGTRVYLPGSEHGIQTIRSNGETTRYKTDVPIFGMSNTECIDIWLDSQHYCSGQKVSMLELCEWHAPLCNQHEYQYMMDKIVAIANKQHDFMLRAIQRAWKKSHKHTQEQE